MKRKISLILACIAFILFVISHEHKQEITIVIPAHTKEIFSYSIEDISPTSNSIKVYATNDLEDTTIHLQDIYNLETNDLDAQYLTHGMATKVTAQKGRWYKIGISLQNTTNKDRTITLLVKGVRVKLKS